VEFPVLQRLGLEFTEYQRVLILKVIKEGRIASVSLMTYFLFYMMK